MTTQAVVVLKEEVSGIRVVDEQPSPGSSKPPLTPPTELVERPEVLESRVYKLSTPHAGNLYVVVSRMEVEGHKYLAEVFVVTSDPDSFQWVTALTKVISGVFRINIARRIRGGNQFLIKQLGSVMDPRGGHFYGGKMYSSEVARIAEILAREIKALEDPSILSSPPFSEDSGHSPNQEKGTATFSRARCPNCGSNMVKQAGCEICTNCDYSKCS